LGIVCLSEFKGAADQVDALMQANSLVAAEFYPRKGSALADALALNSYRLRHAAQNLGLHLNEGARGHHVTLLAVAPQSQAAQLLEQQQQPQQQRGDQQQQGERRQGRGYAADAERARTEGAVGVCNVTVRYAGETIAAAAGCEVGAPFAMVSNSAPQLRRQRSAVHKGCSQIDIYHCPSLELYPRATHRSPGQL
jgi:hypothetical protein